MKTIDAWLDDLNTQDILISLEGEQLRISAPKGAMTKALSAQLSNRKTEIIKYLSEKDVISKAPSEDVKALSYAQQGLWFMDQLEQDSATYNMPSALRLTGDLNEQALQRSLTEICQRHEILRSTYPLKDGSPIHHTNTAFDMDLNRIDLQDISGSAQTEKIRQLAEKEALRPFDLQTGPLIRGTLLILSANAHVLLLTMHHIVSDGWSIGLIGRELSVLYAAFSQGETSPLEPLHIQYSDFAAWQLKWLDSADYQDQLKYWTDHLQNVPSVLELPVDRTRPPQQSYSGKTEVVRLNNQARNTILDLGRASGGTLFMTLMAAFAVLVQRYTDQDDLVIGTPIANRNRPEVESLIGFFANTLPMRMDLAGDPDFRTLLSRVRDVTIDVFENQDVPFEKIVEALHIDRDLSRNPLVQIVFVLQNAPLHASGSSSAGLKGLEIEPVAFETGTVRLDMEVHVWEELDGLKIEFIYNTDLFDQDTVARLGANFVTLLMAIAEQPDQPISKLEILTPLERKTVLSTWNDTAKDYVRDLCVHHRFADYVAHTPDAIAVRCDGQGMTYLQLDKKSNQLAHRLRRDGVKADVPVAICVERSLDMIVGLLGILKAGGAYVPIDPAYPRDRLMFLLDDSKAAVLITQACIFNEEAMAAMALPAPILFIDTEAAELETESTEAPVVDVSAENLAYIIYTSGSTGKPKGVKICHRTVLNLMQGVHPRLDVGERDVWTVFHSFAFDLSVWEIWSPLCSGGTLVVVPFTATQDSAVFHQLLHQEQVTVLNQTPSFMRQLLLHDDFTKQTAPASLRLIICGGEALPQELAVQLLDRDFKVWNFYGPTEATVWSVIKDVDRASCSTGTVPIGKPISNAKAYVLDRFLQPVPIGVVGELHIGGEGLALGYYNRPDLNQDKFIPDPFATAESARLYKTGDMVRWTSLGELQYSARQDTQVKVRGFRIELEEIEAVLSQVEGVGEAVVLVREDIPDDKRITAYVVGKTLPTSDHMRQYLKEKLPAYMVPLAFVELATFPLTPNGKIDRKALPKPQGGGEHSVPTTFCDARTQTEQKIRDVWLNALALKQVGVHDNFFDVGGYSFLLVKVCNRLGEVFAQEFKVVDFFQYPTIAAFAAFIEGDDKNSGTNFQDLDERAAKRKQGLATRQRRNKRHKTIPKHISDNANGTRL